MKFFKTFLAALLAFIVANILWTILWIFVAVVFVAAFGSSSPKVKPNSVLKIDLSESIVDMPSSDPLSGFDFASMSVQRSHTILQAIDAIAAAATDDNIKGIYISLDGGGSIGTANLEELRAEIERFKLSGKFVVSYSEMYGSPWSYYLSSVADSVYLNPAGEINWCGLAMPVMFYKGLLDKIGVKPEVLRHGSFKSAVEPYIMDRMSPENRLQMETLVNSFWGVIVESVAEARNIPIDSLQQYATDLSAMMADDALEKGLVDDLKYQDQVEDMMRGELQIDADQDIEYISLGSYIATLAPNVKNSSKNRIEIIYASGQIVSGASGKDMLGATTLAEQLAKARLDEDVKAVVLRVNSPGGSALAAEVIWREMELLRQQKPVIVSMGDYAASGGYYISAPADVIVADKMTLTGSIGVFGLLFNAGDALKNKVGITVDVAKSNPSADMGGFYRGLTTYERNTMMKSIENVYETFVNHVADGRNMTFASVDAIGQGCVWAGVDAKHIGLIDDFGGLREAILIAAEKAEVGDDFRVSEMSMPYSGISALLNNIESQIAERNIRKEFGTAYDEYRYVQGLIENQGVQAICPYRFAPVK